MTKDLEETLQELGPCYRAVVDRLAAGAAPAFDPPRPAFRLRLPRPPALSAAAAVAILLGAASLFIVRSGDPSAGYASDTSPRRAAANEYLLAEMRDQAAVLEMIRTQNADGSWQNDFLTRRNAAALSRRPEPEARIACKKAMRNLRNRGLL